MIACNFEFSKSKKLDMLIKKVITNRIGWGNFIVELQVFSAKHSKNSIDIRHLDYKDTLLYNLNFLLQYSGKCNIRVHYIINLFGLW